MDYERFQSDVSYSGCGIHTDSRHDVTNSFLTYSDSIARHSPGPAPISSPADCVARRCAPRLAVLAVPLRGLLPVDLAPLLRYSSTVRAGSDKPPFTSFAGTSRWDRVSRLPLVAVPHRDLPAVGLAPHERAVVRALRLAGSASRRALRERPSRERDPGKSRLPWRMKGEACEARP